MAPAFDLADLSSELAEAVEIVPPHWVDDDEIVELEGRHELLLFERFADGTLLVTPPAGWKSDASNAQLTGQVVSWSRNGHDGLCMGPSGGVALPDGSLFAPDATYISRERWDGANHDLTFAHAVPDAAFEILSKSDRIRTTMKKIAAYLRNGVRLVVLIDPKRRTVFVGRQGDAEPRELGDVETLDCSPVMPGFVLDVAAIRDVANRRAERGPRRREQETERRGGENERWTATPSGRAWSPPRGARSTGGAGGPT